MRQRLPLFVAAFWWGSLGLLGFVVVPLLFQQLTPAALAGQMAARLFSAQSWIGMVCGLLLLTLSRGPGESRLHGWAQYSLGWILAAFLLALLLEFAVAPRIVARENLRLWHGLGSAMYLLQWLCLTRVLWRLGPPADPAPAADARDEAAA